MTRRVNKRCTCGCLPSLMGPWRRDQGHAEAYSSCCIVWSYTKTTGNSQAAAIMQRVSASSADQMGEESSQFQLAASRIQEPCALYTNGGLFERNNDSKNTCPRVRDRVRERPRHEHQRSAVTRTTLGAETRKSLVDKHVCFRDDRGDYDWHANRTALKTFQKEFQDSWLHFQ